MGESIIGSQNGEPENVALVVEEAEQAKADGVVSETQNLGLPKEPSFSRWCEEDGVAVLERSSEGSTVEESEDFELPLLRGGGSEQEAPDTEIQRSNDNSRQRSMRKVDVNGNGKSYAPLDIENGMSISDSRAKLEISEQSAQNSISAAVVLKTLFFIVVWYTFSTCLTLYNKTLLGNHLGKFPAPLLMNTVHFTMQAVLSKAIIRFQSRGSESSTKMSWRDYFIRVVPTALGTALDINLSNASLVFISVTFATMCKSASPIFLLLFAFAFRLETPSIKLVGVIFIISIGVLLTVAKETEFELWGFVFVMLAAVMSGFRWSMTQILLQKEAFGLQNPITLMSYVAPVMAVATAVLSLMMDPWQNFKKNGYFDNSKHIFRSCLLLLVGGALAFCMVLTEYILVSATSAVTVTVAGIVKEAVTILVAVYYFHDQFTFLKGIGLFTIMVGVGFFNWYKYQKLKEGQTSKYEETNPIISNDAAKYVILDDVDLQDDDT